MQFEVSGRTTRYGWNPAVGNVSLSVGAGEVISLIGPNEAGRSGAEVLAQTDLFDTFVRGNSP